MLKKEQRVEGMIQRKKKLYKLLFSKVTYDKTRQLMTKVSSPEYILSHQIKIINIHSYKSFVSMVNTQFNAKVKCIRSDNRNEFMLKDFYKGIRYTSCFMCWHLAPLSKIAYQRGNTTISLVFPELFYFKQICQKRKKLDPCCLSCCCTLGRKTCFDLF